MDRYPVRLTLLLGLLLSLLPLAPTAAADDEPKMIPAPDRGEGEGPFQRLIIRGATLIDGTGAPPIGPVDIVVENNRIAERNNFV